LSQAIINIAIVTESEFYQVSKILVTMMNSFH